MTVAILFQTSAQSCLTAYQPFRAEGFEIHVFATGPFRPITVADVKMGHVHPILTSDIDTGNPEDTKSPDDRAVDAAHIAQEAAKSGLTLSGHTLGFQKKTDMVVVAYEIDSVQNLPPAADAPADWRIYSTGAYEVHVFYPDHCPDRILTGDHVRMMDAQAGLIGGEYHELNGDMDAQNRVEVAAREVQWMTRDTLPKAIAFFTGRHGHDECLNKEEIAYAVRDLSGYRTLPERVVLAVNHKYGNVETTHNFRETIKKFAILTYR